MEEAGEVQSTLGIDIVESDQQESDNGASAAMPALAVYIHTLGLAGHSESQRGDEFHHSRIHRNKAVFESEFMHRARKWGKKREMKRKEEKEMVQMDVI